MFIKALAHFHKNRSVRSQSAFGTRYKLEMGDCRTSELLEFTSDTGTFECVKSKRTPSFKDEILARAKDANNS
jgi:hypothetical protein